MDRDVKIAVGIILALLFFLYFGKEIFKSNPYVQESTSETPVTQNQYLAPEPISQKQKFVVNNETDPIILSRKLAMDDNGGSYISDTSLTIIRTKILLNKIAKIYRLPADTVAIYVQNAKNLLHKNGISDTNFNILRQINIMGKQEGIKLQEALALYGVLRLKSDEYGQ